MITESDSLRIGSLNLLNNPVDLGARLPTLVDEVTANGLQVLCLQEVLEGERSRVEDALFSVGFTSCSYAPSVMNRRTGLRDGTAIFSRVAPTAFDALLFQVDGERVLDKPTIPAVTAHLVVNGRNVHVLSCHFAWGGHSESVRLRQASEVSLYAQSIRASDPEAVVLLAGDLNAAEDSSTVRFLHGQAGEHEW